MTSLRQPTIWAERADAAESAVVTRHVRRLWHLPGTRLGVISWPPVLSHREFFRWHYWWQAHLIDCAVDAATRNPTAERRALVGQLARTHRMRNITGWTNNYYDDMAWLTLALERAERAVDLNCRAALRILTDELNDGWNEEIGAVPWRVGADFYNTPANGPVGIALARLGMTGRAARISDWIDSTLRDKQTGLIIDGIHLPSGELERPTYTYCQGVVLGLDTELAVRTGEPRFADRVQSLVTSVADHLTSGGVIHGGGGGDGGLFNGILARYLALTAVMLPGADQRSKDVRAHAAETVLTSAEAAWSNRLAVDEQPLFSDDWRTAAELPRGGGDLSTFTGGTVTASSPAERDLSVQLSGWLLMEAAHHVSAAGF